MGSVNFLASTSWADFPAILRRFHKTGYHGVARDRFKHYDQHGIRQGLSKRKIFDEMMEGIAAMKSHREGKITLRTYNVEAAPLPKVDSKLIRDTRKRLHCSRAVFARKLRINERTLEKWEQGRRKPNPQAAALVLLVRKYPDTLDRLERVAVG